MSVITSYFIATVWTSHIYSKFLMNHSLLLAFKLITIFKICCTHILFSDVLVFRKYSDVMLWLVARKRGGEWREKQWFQSLQNIQLCSIRKLAFNILSWWIWAMTDILHTQLTLWRWKAIVWYRDSVHKL